MNLIRLDPKAVSRMLAVVAVVILVASVIGRFAAYRLDNPIVRVIADFLYVDNERNLPTGLAVLLLLIATLLLGTISTLERQSASRWAGYWMVLTAGFAILTVDEAWSFHEKLIGPGRALLGGGEMGIFFYSWVIFAIALMPVLAAMFFRFVMHLPADTRKRFLMAATLFVGGAVGCELIAGMFNELNDLGTTKGQYGLQHFQYSLLATVEEGLEFAGTIVFIRALLLHLAANPGYVQVRFDTARTPGSA